MTRQGRRRWEESREKLYFRLHVIGDVVVLEHISGSQLIGSVGDEQKNNAQVTNTHLWNGKVYLAISDFLVESLHRLFKISSSLFEKI